MEHNSLITIQGKQIDLRSAITKYCNLGKTNFGSKSRQKKFFGSLDTCASLYNPLCKMQPSECSGKIVEVGQIISGVC